jgi:hypothetical protein
VGLARVDRNEELVAVRSFVDGERAEGFIRESVAPTAADAVSTSAAARSQVTIVKATPMLPN